jgi:hypothetical protein
MRDTRPWWLVVILFAAARPVAGQDTLLTAVHAYGRSFGESRAVLQQTLGAPLRVSTKGVPSEHVRGGVDTAIGVWYQGMVFSMWRSGTNGKEVLESLMLVGSSVGLPGGITVGRTPVSEVTRLLGAPHDSRAAQDTLVLAYLAPGIGPDEFVEFHTVGGVLRKVFWRFFVN